MALYRPHKLLFILTLLLGTTMAVSSTSWFAIWVGLELNLLSFVPLILSNNNAFSSESAFKYFLVQALGSAIILTGSAFSYFGSDFAGKIITLGVLLKMGAAPFHFWLPPVMQGMSWNTCFMLLTVQKFAPMAMIYYSICPNTNSWLTAASMLSGLVGGWGGLKQTSLRQLMAYSSISHMGWMLAAFRVGSDEWELYFLVYSVATLSVILVFQSTQVYYIPQLSNLMGQPINLIAIFLSLFSLGGVPPMLGFLPKMTVVSALSNQGSFIWLFILTMSSLLPLFFYFRLMNMYLTLSYPKMTTTPRKPVLVAAMVTAINLFFCIAPYYI